MKKKEDRLEKQMAEVTSENKRLTDPLAKANSEVDELRRQLSNYEKDKQLLAVSHQWPGCCIWCTNNSSFFSNLRQVDGARKLERFNFILWLLITLHEWRHRIKSTLKLTKFQGTLVNVSAASALMMKKTVTEWPSKYLSVLSMRGSTFFALGLFGLFMGHNHLQKCYLCTCVWHCSLSS